MEKEHYCWHSGEQLSNDIWQQVTQQDIAIHTFEETIAAFNSNMELVILMGKWSPRLNTREKSLTHSSLLDSLSHSLTHSLTHSLSLSLTHSLTH